jgi:hypothetical protein
MTVAIPISPQAERRLAERVKAAGVDFPTFVSCLLEAEAERLGLEHSLRPEGRPKNEEK